MLLGDASKLAERYKICRHTQGSVVRMSLTPLQAGSVYKEITLTFVADTPTEITMYDSLGQRTTITLTEALVNPQLDTELFVFNPPVGVDIFQDF